jgi:MOSC domain-containing protein YiiM
MNVRSGNPATRNITTSGLDLLALSADAQLHLGDAAIVIVTGRPNPCTQLERIRPGLKKATLERDPDGNVIRKAGIMGIVLTGGEVRIGNQLTLNCRPHHVGRSFRCNRHGRKAFW